MLVFDVFDVFDAKAFHNPEGNPEVEDILARSLLIKHVVEIPVGLDAEK